jgi:hypothetical protein
MNVDHRLNVKNLSITVLDHFTEKSFYRKFLTETPFDRTPFDRMPFDRKFILPKKVIWPKTKNFKRSFDRKYLENGHLTENLT